MQKLIIAELEIQQALTGIECPKILRSAIWNLSRTESLEPIIQSIIESGKATNAIDAIRFLVKHQMVNGKLRSNKVNLSDLQNYSSNNTLQKKLDKVLGRESRKGDADRSRVFGVKSHVAVPKLLSGSLIRIEKKQKDENQGEQTVIAFLDSEPPENGKEGANNNSRIAPSSRHVAQYIDKAVTLREKILQEVFPYTSRRNYQLLAAMLRRIFHEDLDEIIKLGERDSQSQYYAFSTLMCWVGALVAYKSSEPLILFKELPVIPHRYDVGLGRIDALAVESIDGEKPNKKQIELLKKFSSEWHESVGHLIWKLVQAFGSKIEFIIYDWKFAVGDGPNGIKKGVNVIKTTEVVERPLIGHKNQMDRYMAAVLVSYALVAYTESKYPQTIWKTEHFTMHGEIHYFLPDRLPIVHRVDLTEEEKKEVFRVQVVENYSNAVRRSNLRMINKDWLKLAIGLVEEKIQTEKGLRELQTETRTNKVKKYKDTGLQQLRMDEILAGAKKIRVKKFIDEFIERKFVDEFKAIEHIRNDDKGLPVYQMHLEALVKAMTDGKIQKGRYWNAHRGGKIRCIVHNEKTASMLIDFKRGFKCFGCGVGGTFAPESVPEDLEGVVALLSKTQYRKQFGAIQEFSVPERQKKCMNDAQRFLQGQFFQSPAEKYLQDKRRLTPDLCYANGAGYGTVALVWYLMDNMEYTYDELAEFGFFNFSPRADSRSPLVVGLIERGLNDDQIKKINKKTDELGYPIFILENRLTYPLDINGIITSFYGRSVDLNCPKAFCHVKTQCNTVPQGGYNLTKAMKKAIDRAKGKQNVRPVLGITESPIDVDTFAQRSDLKDFGGMVGTSNDILWQVAAGFEGDIILAFDWDESKPDVNGKENGLAGQKNTAKFVEYLKAVGFRYNVYDFSEPFAIKNPGYKDMNKFWTEQWDAYINHKKVITDPNVIFHSRLKRLL